MKVQFKRSFAKDLQSINQKSLLSRTRKSVQSLEKAESLEEIPNLKKLGTAGGYYRIRLGDYRIGLRLEGDAVTFIRILHRKEIYRYFP